MSERSGNSFDDLLHELNKDPDFREEYRRIGPYFDLIREVFNRRKEIGWTQSKLADEAGTYQSNVSRIESGELDARISTIIELAEAMGTRVEIRFIPYLSEDDEENAFSMLVTAPYGTSSQTIEYSISKQRTSTHTSRTTSH